MRHDTDAGYCECGGFHAPTHQFIVDTQHCKACGLANFQHPAPTAPVVEGDLKEMLLATRQILAEYPDDEALQIEARAIDKLFASLTPTDSHTSAAKEAEVVEGDTAKRLKCDWTFKSPKTWFTACGLSTEVFNSCHKFCGFCGGEFSPALTDSHPPAQGRSK